jgi:hypothetical protein
MRPLIEHLRDTEALDATLADDDWPLVQQLWRSGMTNRDIYGLLRLRLAARHRGDPSADGLETDPKAQFARWLVQQGRLHEGD